MLNREVFSLRLKLERVSAVIKVWTCY